MAEDADWGNTLDDESIVTLRRMRSKVFGLRGNVAGGAGGRAPDSSVAFSDPGLQFYNDSSEEAPAGACMRVTGFTDSDGETGGTAGKGSPIIKIGKPDTTFGLYVCNGSLAVAAGEYGTCYDVGDVEFKYNSGTPARSEGFGPTPSQWYWSKGYPCCIQCYGNLDTSLKIAYGTLSPITTLLGHAITDLSASTSYSTTSDYKIYTGTTGSESDSGFTTLPSIYMRVAVAKGKKFTIEWINNGWQVNAAAPRVHIGKTDSSVAAGASGTVSVWTGTPGSESDSGDNITGVRNRTSVDIPTTKWVRVEYINDSPYMEPWEC